MKDKAKTEDTLTAGVNFIGGMNTGEVLGIHGHFDVTCTGPDGEVKWSDAIENLVVTVGKNFMLDTVLAGSAYTVTGPFMGLISGASAPTIVAGDTMGSHAGWLESGNANAPTYTSPRKTMVFSAASAGAKTLSAGLAFPITSTGTVAGAFATLGTGAVSTIDNTGGTLMSAGTFTVGSRAVFSSDTITVGYTLTLT